VSSRGGSLLPPPTLSQTQFEDVPLTSIWLYFGDPIGAIPQSNLLNTKQVIEPHRKGKMMEPTDSSSWAEAHPQSVRPLNNLWLSLTIRVLELFRPVREALAVLSLAPRRGEIVLMVPARAWDILEETLQMDAVSPMFDIHLRLDIIKALKEVRQINLDEAEAD
jgi:hypothetical protein